jgi:hypothetical protein
MDRFIGLVFALLLVAAAALLPADGAEGNGAAEGPLVVRLVQISGAIEPAVPTLAPGKYLFMITNATVDHPVDFVLRRLDGADGATKRVVGSRLSRLVKRGETASTGVVLLREGTYVYSSPRNSTPEYRIEVR